MKKLRKVDKAKKDKDFLKQFNAYQKEYLGNIASYFDMNSDDPPR
jgi:hypothetical protein